MFLDSENEGVMYIKTSDNVGMCTLRTFKFTEVTPTKETSPQIDLETDGYDISDIIMWQSGMKHRYAKKIAKLL